MNKTLGLVGALSLIASVAACATPPVAAPGAEQVRETTVAADVQSCKAVGNLDPGLYVGMDGTDVLLRDQVVGLGGDTVLLTGGAGGGIAYRCAKS
jgi:hypothetical protein